MTYILNKCRPKLVQGLRQDIEINFHIYNINGSVAQWIKCLAADLKDHGSIPKEGDFFTYISFKEEMNGEDQQQQQEQLK